jgi:chloramphenicol-sensitive protein RarD
MVKPDRNPRSNEAQGILFGIAAFGMWGLFPLYWKSLSAVPAFQILAHRILWAFAFTLVLTLALRRGRLLAEVFRSWKRLLSIAGAGALISVNWGLYIWAVNASQILETSLGYYLNPLVSAALGALVLRERLDRGMVVSYLVAGLGIAIQALSYGRLPWIALSLACTFALYGLVKKMASLDVLTGLTLETAAAFPFALGFLLLEEKAGRGAFGNLGSLNTTLMVLAGPVTAVPLLSYAAGVVRLPLSKMGLLQYISPTLQLLVGILVYGEMLDLTRAVTLGCVVAALVIFGVTRGRRNATGA